MNSSEKASTCLVIGPSGANSPASELAEEAFEFLIAPALARCGLADVRAGSKPAGDNSADHALCIVILTGADPAVYYRLARVQATRLPVIALLDQDDPLLVDASVVAVLGYRLTPSSTKNLAQVERLVQRIAQVRLSISTGIKNADATAEAIAASPLEVFQHETEERPFIRDAEEELWLVQETGSLLAEKAKAELKAFLRRGGRVCAAVTAPTSAVAHSMALRNANLDDAAILGRARLAAAHLNDLVADVGADAERLSVRYVPYPVGFTLTLADPTHTDTRKRRGLARYAGFKTPFVDKLDLLVSADRHAPAFENFFGEARRLFMHGSKLVLLMGPPRSGKTTLLTELADAQPAGEALFTLLSPEVSDDGERQGFEYTATGLPQPVQFARRQPSGKYEVVKGALDAAIAAITGAQAAGQVLLLDEIGPLQLEQPGFRDCIDALVKDPRVSVIASLAQPERCEVLATRRYVESLMRHPRSTVLHLKQSENGIRARIEPEFRERLAQELAAALLLMRQMPRPLWGEAA